MRKAFFAIILVGAAFAGGAAINGPGLERIKGVILSRIAPADAPSRATPGPIRQVPPAPLPPIVPPTPTPSPAVATAPSPPPAPAPDRPGGPAIAVSPPPPRSEATPLDLPAPEPAAIPPESDRTSDPAVATASGPEAPARDWAELRRKMRGLGISRYEVDGEPGGRCRFRCLIPLAGRRAVGQQFEGEGDDDFQAAEAALRRVALWRATEMAPP